MRFIQETILRSDPNLNGAPFTIEVNKVVKIAGVRSEIDVLVKTLPGSPYESVSIFECKNRKKAASKNDVILLAKLVEATGANRGYLVARKFSKDAEAQSRLDGRLGLVSCTDEFASPLSNLQLLWSAPEPRTITVLIKRRGVSPAQPPQELIWKDRVCHFAGRPTQLAQFLNTQIRPAIAENHQSQKHEFREEGTHCDRKCSVRIEFEPGEFMLDGFDVEAMVLEIQYAVKVRRQKLLSKFELTAQGRAFTLEPIDDLIRGNRIEATIVQRFC